MRDSDFMGYGVLCDGKPAGIWPLGIIAARAYIDRKIKSAAFTRDNFEIVPLSAGSPVPQVAPTPILTPILRTTAFDAPGAQLAIGHEPTPES